MKEKQVEQLQLPLTKGSAGKAGAERVALVSETGLPQDSITRFGRTVRDMAVINGLGWWSVIRTQALHVVRIFSELPLLTLFFIGFNFLACLSVIPAWMIYKVVLLGGEPETVGIGSAARLFFFLPGAYGLFAVVFGFPRRAIIYYVLVVLAAVAYGLGFYEPRWIHTSMLKPADFTFTAWMTVYGVALGGAALLALRGALNKAIFQVQDLLNSFQSVPRESL